MKILFLLFVLSIIPLWAVDITITIGANSETFTVSSEDVVSVQALKATRVDENDKCPSLKKDGGVKHDCSTGIQYLMWKIKQLVNHAKERFPQGQDAIDKDAIIVLQNAIDARKVE